MYDPEALGAQCSRCPLHPSTGCGKQLERAGGPVPPIMRGPETVAFVGKEPGKDEVANSKPFVGGAGMTLRSMIEPLGMMMSEVSLNNAVACQPPGNDHDRLLAILKKVNKVRVREGQPPIPRPVDCCRPRLLRELEGYKHVVPLGALAAEALIPRFKGGIMKNRGNMVELVVDDPDDPRAVPGRLMVPTLHPAMVQRKGRWEPVARRDLARAQRWFNGALMWVPPGIEYMPSPERLEEILFNYTMDFNGQPTHLYDVETDGINAMTANLRCLAIGTPEWSVVVPFKPIRGDTFTFFGKPVAPYDRATLERIRDIIRRWAIDPNILKVGHNAGIYDRLVMEQPRHFGVTPAPLFDTLLAHRVVQPELPHSLAFVGSYYTDVHAWKGDKGSGASIAVSAKDDGELWKYNALDTTVNARVLPPLWDEVVERRQHEVCRIDHRIQDVCVGMHKNGLFIDQKERARLQVQLTEEVLKWQYRTRAAVQAIGTDLSKVLNPAVVKKLKRAIERGTDNADTWGLSSAEADEGWQFSGLELGFDERAFNPGSSEQLRVLLWDVWDLPAPTDMKPRDLFTKSGDISTGDAILRRLIMDQGIDPAKRMFIQAVRKYRAAAKILGTYIRPLRMPVGERKLDEGCIVSPDGHYRPDWRPGPVTGRLAGGIAMTLTKFPINTSKLVISKPGMSLVGSDLDQLELRLAASRWGAAGYLMALEQGIDPHQITMKAVFEDRLTSFEGQPTRFGAKDYEPKGQYDQMRDLSKKILYASQYGATTPTVHRLITEAEDAKTGKLLYDWLTLDDTAALHEAWKQNTPEYPAGWKREMETFGLQGFLTEEFTGRRRDFADAAGDRRGNMSEIVNFPVQAGGAGIVNLMTMELVDAIPFGKWGPGTGIIMQKHDFLCVKCPDEAAPWVQGVMDEIMNKRYPGMPIDITAKADIGRNLGEV